MKKFSIYLLFIFSYTFTFAQKKALIWAMPLSENLKINNEGRGDSIAISTEKGFAVLDAKGKIHQTPFKILQFLDFGYFLINKNDKNIIYDAKLKKELVNTPYDKVRVICKGIFTSELSWKQVITDSGEEVFAEGEEYFLSHIGANICCATESGTNNKFYFNATKKIEEKDLSTFLKKNIRVKSIGNQQFTINFTGKAKNKIIKDTFTSVITEHDNSPNFPIYLTGKNGKKGLIDTAATWYIRPEYDEIKMLHYPHFEVRKGKFWALFDAKLNKFTTDFKYHYISSPNDYNGVYWASQGLNDSYTIAVLDANTLQEIFSANGGSISYLADSSLIYQKNEYNGIAYLYGKNKEIIPTDSFFKFEAFSNHAHWAKTAKDKWGLMNNKGQWILKPTLNMSAYQNKIAPWEYDLIKELGAKKDTDSDYDFGVKEDDFFYLNTKGKLIFPYPCTAKQNYYNHIWLIKYKGKFAVCAEDTTAEEAIYDEIKVYDSGWVALREGKKWGLMKLN